MPIRRCAGTTKASPGEQRRWHTLFLLHPERSQRGRPVVCSGPHEPGNLIVVRMGSREKHGERLRSNRLSKGDELHRHALDPALRRRLPELPADVAVKQLRFDGTGDWPHYGHPESMQTVGDILVVGVDSPLGGGTQAMQVLFVNVAHPENPDMVNRFLPARSRDQRRHRRDHADAERPLSPAAITGAKNADGVFNEKIYFFESQPKEGCTGELFDAGDRGLPAVGHVGFERPRRTATTSGSPGPRQRPGTPDVPVPSPGQRRRNALFRRGTGRDDIADLIRIGDDMLDLYRIDFAGCEAPGCDIRLKLVSYGKKNSNPNLEPGSGRPATAPSCSAWTPRTSPRHRRSTSRRPRAAVLCERTREHGGRCDGQDGRMAASGHGQAGQSDVPAGGAALGAVLDSRRQRDVPGRAGGKPVTKASIQFFDETDFGRAATSSPISSTGTRTTSTTSGIRRDAVRPAPGFQRRGESWRWFAPSGCTFAPTTIASVTTRSRAIARRPWSASGQSLNDADLGTSTRLSRRRQHGRRGQLGAVPDDRDQRRLRLLQLPAGHLLGSPPQWDIRGERNDRGLQWHGTGRSQRVPDSDQVGPPQRWPGGFHDLQAAASSTSRRPSVRRVVFNSLNQQLGVDVAYFLNGCRSSPERVHRSRQTRPSRRRDSVG